MKLAPDKKKHFFVGIFMGIVLQIFFLHLVSPSLVKSAALAFAASFIIAYCFELFSKVTGIGHYEFMDAVAGTAGATIGLGVVLLVYFF